MLSEHRQQEFHKVSNDDLRRLFPAAFSIDPTLEPTEFYDYLKEGGFDEQKAILRVLDRAKQPGEYFLPASLLKPHSTSAILSESPQSPDADSSPNLFVTPITKRRRAPVENSDDDEAGKTSKISSRKKPGPTFKRPPPLEESDSDSATSDSEISEDEDIRPAKRLARAFQSVEGKPNPKSLRKNSSFRTPSLTPQTSSTASFSTDSTSKISERKLVNRKAFDSDLFDSSDVEEDEGDGDYYDESWSESNSELEDDVHNWEKYPLGSSPKESPKKRSSPTRGGNLNDLVLKHRNNTKATAWCHYLAKPFYPNNIDLVEERGHDANPYGEYDLRALPEYLDQVRKAAWSHETRNIAFPLPSYYHDGKSGKSFYPSMRIDGVDFYPGDCVMVRSSEASSTKKKRTPVPERKEYDPWFAKIVYLYKDEFGDGNPMVHLQWFQHGSATVLGELAGTNELFLLSQCDDNAPSCIASKIQVAREEGVGVVEGKYQGHNYFYRLHYDPSAEKFTNAALLEFESDQRSCECCRRRREATETGSIRIEKDRNGRITSVCHKGVTYGLLDFIYVFEEPTKPYMIGQIKRFYDSESNNKGPKLKVDVYERHNELHPDLSDQVSLNKFHPRDERRLFKSGKILKVDFEQVEEKCYVRHKDHIEDQDRFKAEKGRFWVKDKVSTCLDPNGCIRLTDLVPLPAEEMKYSERSKIELQLEEYEKSEFFQHNKALRTLDIFAGIGGLTIGLNQNGALKTFWALEFAPVAARTFSRNNSDVQMFIADASTLLDRRIRLCKGEKLEPYLDEDGNIIPDLPHPSEVDMINGGPPCPAYSGANRHKTWDDIKNTLVILFLSYLEFYKPKYFLLENVRGLLSHRIGAVQVAKGKTEGGIEQGTLKLILRTITGLGYQVEYALLQAAEHGVPQSRPRVFFWASRPDYLLPKFSQPENVVERGGVWDWHRTRRSAPHEMVTVGDVVTDLPHFEWDNPHVIIPETDADKADRLKRWDNGIAQYPVSRDERWIGMDQLPYAASKPLNGTQRKLRAQMPKESAVITNHVTMQFGNTMTECVANVPLRPGADHRNMPLALRQMQRTTCPSNKNAAKNRHYAGRIGRLDIDGAFNTCMTSMNLLGMNGKLLHPFLHRVVTVREYLRAQGFADDFDFDLEDEENIPKFVIRGIGNSVPVPLAAALGDGLLQSLLEKFRTEMKQTRNSRSATPQVKREEFPIAHRHRPFQGKGDTFNEPIELDDDDDLVEIDSFLL